MTDELLTVAQVAEALGVSKATLYQWRYQGRGPVGMKVEGGVRYRRSALDTYLKKQEEGN